jgi:hypothetical protein
MHGLGNVYFWRWERQYCPVAKRADSGTWVHIPALLLGQWPQISHIIFLCLNFLLCKMG